MAKVYKAVIYMTDANGQIEDLEQLNDELTGAIERIGLTLDIGEYKESDEFEWNDDLLINKRDAEIEDFEAYLRDQINVKSWF